MLCAARAMCFSMPITRLNAESKVQSLCSKYGECYENSEIVGIVIIAVAAFFSMYRWR